MAWSTSPGLTWGAAPMLRARRLPRVLVSQVEVLWTEVEDCDRYPFDVPFIRNLGVLEFDHAVSFLLGENGSGKSTLLGGIASGLGMNPEGGTGNMEFQSTDERSVSDLGRWLRIARTGVRRSRTFYLRAESFFNVATAVDRYEAQSSYGNRSLHTRSHGESFLAFALHRWVPGGLYLLDEPESGLSVQGQLQMLRIIWELTRGGSQFIIATHSPILSALPEAAIIECTADGPRRCPYEETELVALYRSFMGAPDSFLRHLLED